MSIRLKNWDYRSNGAYFVTLCTKNRKPVFSSVTRDGLTLSPVGRIVQEEWLHTEKLRTAVTLDAYVLMPNHLHGIIMLEDVADRIPFVGASRRLARASVSSPSAGSLGAIIGQFKPAVTRRLSAAGFLKRGSIWQRNYYEHVIRDYRDLEEKRDYIAANPSRWAEDEYYPF